MLTNEQPRRLVLEAPDVIAILEPDLTVRFVSCSTRGAPGFLPVEMEGSDPRGYLDSGEAEDAFYEPGYPSRGLALGGPKNPEIKLRHRDGSWRRSADTVVDWVEDPGFQGIAVCLGDVAGWRVREERLAHEAVRDPQTGSPNRALSLDLLTRASGAGGREDEPVAVLFLDLDDFKSINDSLGHAAGDRLLVALGQKMRVCLRPGDVLARLGGDEFAALIEGSAGDAERVAERLGDALRELLDLEGREVRAFTTVGVATSSNASVTERPETLLRAAGAATYRAKKRTRRAAASATGSGP